MSVTRPLARKNELVLQEFTDGVLIYDLKTNKAFSLNQISTAVWQLCDGNKSVAEISELLSIKFDKSISKDLIWLAVEQLRTEDLLENQTMFSTPFAGMTRREVVRKIGFSAMVALPLVSILVAPTAVSAQSCPATNRPNGCPCAANANCLSTCCGTNGLGSAICTAVGVEPPGSGCRGNCECASNSCPPTAGTPRICA